MGVTMMSVFENLKWYFLKWEGNEECLFCYTGRLCVKGVTMHYDIYPSQGEQNLFNSLSLLIIINIFQTLYSAHITWLCFHLSSSILKQIIRWNGPIQNLYEKGK